MHHRRGVQLHTDSGHICSSSIKHGWAMPSVTFPELGLPNVCNRYLTTGRSNGCARTSSTHTTCKRNARAPFTESSKETYIVSESRVCLTRPLSITLPAAQQTAGFARELPRFRPQEMGDKGSCLGGFEVVSLGPWHIVAIITPSYVLILLSSSILSMSRHRNKQSR